MHKATKASQLLTATALTLFSALAAAQQEKEDIRLPEPKRFIDKVEIFAGPSLSFNYGNKFVENYKDENIQNKRLLKVGYTFGLGLYHPVSDRIDINARVLYEQKGSKAELNLPLNDPNYRLVIGSKYVYRYHTIAVSARVFIDPNKKISISLGGYYSLVKSVKGHESIYDTQDRTFDEGSFRGRSLRTLDDEGHVVSLTYIPGLQSFEKSDYGVKAAFSYLILLRSGHSISIQLIDHPGLKNINKLTNGNMPEKNHTVCLSAGYILQRPAKK